LSEESPGSILEEVVAEGGYGAGGVSLRFVREVFLVRWKVPPFSEGVESAPIRTYHHVPSPSM
jgi:hypothetical protein